MNSHFTVLFAITGLCFLSHEDSEAAGKHDGDHVFEPEVPPRLMLPARKPELDTVFGEASRVLHFEANNGQVDDEVKFLVRGSGYQLFLTGTEAIMVLQPVTGQPACSPMQELDTYSAAKTES